MRVYRPSTFSGFLFCFTLLLSRILFFLYFVFVCIAFFMIFSCFLCLTSFASIYINNLKLEKEMNHQLREDPLQNKTC